MVVCRFWLENRCKFGATCKFEHSRDGTPNNWQGGGGGGQKVSFQNNYSFQNKTPNQYRWSSNQNKGQDSGLGSAVDVVSALPDEMKRWRESKMWPFSSVSLEKDLPSLPEFQDVSVEEMRYEAYLCKAQGSMEPYVKKYQALASEFENKRRQLEHLTMDLKEKLIKFVEDARRNKNSQSSSSGFSFSTQPSTAQPGLFGKSQTFGSTPQSPGQQTSNVFGGTSTAQSSLFGGSSASPSSTSVFSNNRFGALASNSAFGESGGSSIGGTLFGKPVAGTGSLTGGAGTGLFGGGNQNSNNNQTSLLGPGPQVSPGLFGQPATQPGSGLFGSGSAASGQASAPSVFGSPANSGSRPTPNLFGSSTASSPQPAAPNPFGTSGAATPLSSLLGPIPSVPATPQSSLLGPIPGTQPPSLFGKPVNPTSGSGQPQSQAVPLGPPNLFGKPSPGFGAPATQGSNSSGGLFGKGPSLNSGGMMPGRTEITIVESSTLYTPLSDLTESEKAAFEAKAFELGKIPIRPPPKELVRVG